MSYTFLIDFVHPRELRRYGGMYFLSFMQNILLIPAVRIFCCDCENWGVGGWVSLTLHIVQIRKNVRKNGPPLTKIISNPMTNDTHSSPKEMQQKVLISPIIVSLPLNVVVLWWENALLWIECIILDLCNYQLVPHWEGKALRHPSSKLRWGAPSLTHPCHEQ